MKKMTIKKIAMLLSALTAFSAVSCVTASASESQSGLFPYAMFASSSEEGALTINSRWCNVNGNIASNGTISAGRGNFNGSRTEYAGEEMLYIGESLTEAYFGNAETTDYLDISDTNVFVNVSDIRHN